MKKVLLENKQYPGHLRKIKIPPKQLYLQGNVQLLNKPTIAIIGSRNCTENGKKLARRFAKELSMQGLVIASGMAIGIDTQAHKGALEVGGETIAVLGNGLNNIYPEENKYLYEQIKKQKGLVISEYEPNEKASSNKFLERNRIVSGISIGVLIIEAAYRSGTSVTARIATEQCKKVFVLPHEIEDKHGIGTNKLIRKGAILVTSTEQIINEFLFLKYKKIEKTSNYIKENIENIKTREIYAKIEKGKSTLNEIAKTTKISMNEITNSIFWLEINEYIKKTPTGYKCIKNE